MPATGGTGAGAPQVVLLRFTMGIAEIALSAPTPNSIGGGECCRGGICVPVRGRAGIAEFTELRGITIDTEAVPYPF